MWFVRGLLIVAISSVFLGPCEVDGLTIAQHLKIATYDTINSIWARALQGGIIASKWVVEERGNARQGRGLVTQVTDEDVDKAVAVMAVLFPKHEISSARSTGLGFVDYFKNLFYIAADYFMNTWRTIRASVRDTVDSFVDWNGLLNSWFFAPVQSLFNFINYPYARRARGIHDFYDQFWKNYHMITKNMFQAIVQIPVGMLRGAMKMVTGRASGAEPRSLGSMFGDQIKNDFMKNSVQFSGNPRTIYGQKYHRILQGLSNADLSVANEIVNMLTYAVWSGTGFFKVYQELVKECQSDREKLEYTLIEGETYVDDGFLHAIMDNANAKRHQACTIYRTVIGEDGADSYPFIADQFGALMKTTYDHLSPLPADMVVVDSVSQSMLGNTEPVCMLKLLCMAGYSTAYETTPHPGADLLFGLVVSGRTDFGGILSREHVQKLGTPKMAEAIYRGFHNDCTIYSPPRKTDCANTSMFMTRYDQINDDSP